MKELENADPVEVHRRAVYPNRIAVINQIKRTWSNIRSIVLRGFPMRLAI